MITKTYKLFGITFLIITTYEKGETPPFPKKRFGKLKGEVIFPVDNTADSIAKKIKKADKEGIDTRLEDL